MAEGRPTAPASEAAFASAWGRASQTDLSRTWDCRTGSPQQAFRALRDALEDQLFDVIVTRGVELKATPITDTAAFGGEVVGTKRFGRRYRWGAGLVGAAFALPGLGGALAWFADMIAFGRVELILAAAVTLGGVARLATAFAPTLLVVRLQAEGEAYRAQAPEHQAEVAEVVADMRVTATARLESPEGREAGAHERRDGLARVRNELNGLDERVQAALTTIRLR